MELVLSEGDTVADLMAFVPMNMFFSLEAGGRSLHHAELLGEGVDTYYLYAQEGALSEANTHFDTLERIDEDQITDQQEIVLQLIEITLLQMETRTIDPERPLTFGQLCSSWAAQGHKVVTARRGPVEILTPGLDDEKIIGVGDTLAIFVES